MVLIVTTDFQWWVLPNRSAPTISVARYCGSLPPTPSGYHRQVRYLPDRRRSVGSVRRQAKAWVNFMSKNPAILVPSLTAEENLCARTCIAGRKSSEQLPGEVQVTGLECLTYLCRRAGPTG